MMSEILDAREQGPAEAVQHDRTAVEAANSISLGSKGAATCVCIQAFIAPTAISSGHANQHHDLLNGTYLY